MLITQKSHFLFWEWFSLFVNRPFFLNDLCVDDVTEAYAFFKPVCLQQISVKTVERKEKCFKSEWIFLVEIFTVFIFINSTTRIFLTFTTSKTNLLTALQHALHRGLTCRNDVSKKVRSKSHTKERKFWSLWII